jgi:hypothetical protein
MNFRAGRAVGLFIALAIGVWVTAGTSAADATLSRADLLARMERVMGKLPGPDRRCDLDIKLEEEVDCGDYTRKFLTYQSEPNARVPAYLLTPKNPKLSKNGKPLGILTLHQTHKLGQKVVVGLGDSPNDEYAVELAKRGFTCLAPAYPHLANYAPDLSKYESGTMKAIWDNIRGLDLLTSYANCDPERFAAIGHSLGGHNSLFTAAFDERIKLVITSCGFDSFGDYMNGNIKGWTSARYMPKLLNFAPDKYPFDFDTVLCAIAPRLVFVSAPKGDTNFKWESVDRIVEKAASECGARIRVFHPASAHSFPQHMRENSYAVIEEVLLG